MVFRPFFLTYNPNLVSTTRSLQSWLLQGRQNGMEAHIAVQRRGDFANWLQRERFPFRVDPMPWPDRRSALRAYYHVGRLAWWARRNGIDVIHCNEHNAYPFGIALANLARLPVVCHVRCKLDAGFADWAFGKREPDALIWCTPQMKTECGPIAEKTTRGERQHVIPLGIDLNQFGRMKDQRGKLRREWGIGEDAVVVGMASAVRPGKRIEDFLELAKRIGVRDNARFFFAGGCVPGDEDYFEKMKPAIEDLHSRGVIQWLGHLEPVEPFLHAIDVFISTSEHESFGMSVCEAMACERPVAAYAACSVAEVVGDAGLIVETGDLDGLTAAVERLVVDAELRTRLGQQARERVATEFNPAQSLKQLEEIYRSLVTKKN